MSQHNVEQVIGRLVTDEGFRRRFAADPRAVIGELVEGGVKLNPCEARALVSLDPERVARFAAGLHPCIQKVELHGAGHAGAGHAGAGHAGAGHAGAGETAAADVENGPRRSTTDRNERRERGLEAEPRTEPLHLGETP